MKKAYKIDNLGFYIEDVFVDELGSLGNEYIDNYCPDGFYKPKWNGSEWVEGLTEEEIALKNTTVLPKTELQILKETVDMLVMSML